MVYDTGRWALWTKVRHASASIIGVVALGIVGTGVGTFVASGAASARPLDSTNTQISGAPNPTDVGHSFTVTALECDDTADVQATGKMVFYDIQTHVHLGSVTMSGSIYANCGEAQIVDSESLSPTTSLTMYYIRATYVPGGPTPVTASGPAHYGEGVKGPRFTDVSWTTGASIPNAHLEGATVGTGAKVYAISGSSGDCTDGTGGTVTSAVDAYNTSTGTFESRAPIPNARTGDPAAVMIKGIIYVIGGTASCEGATVTAVDAYTANTNSWTTLPTASDLPASLGGAYACGAAQGSNIYYFEQAGIGVLDTATSPPSWSVLAANPLLDPSEFCDAATIRKDILITGPGDGGADANAQRVLVFNTGSDSLSQATGTTFPAAEHSMVTLMGQAVVAGGDFENTDVDLILPGFQVVQAATPLPESRDDTGQGAALGGKIYIVGGQSSTSTTPAVLIGTPN